jgi:hypothetical protein
MYSTHEQTYSDRMRRLLGQVGGRRLTYQPLTSARLEIVGRQS